MRPADSGAAADDDAEYETRTHGGVTSEVMGVKLLFRDRGKNNILLQCEQFQEWRAKFVKYIFNTMEKFI